jgi:ubiquinol-cytochrome c reductase cytochrome b subunit
MKSLLNWLDNRTGYRELVNDTLYEEISGGAKWRYVTGSMLVFAFITQAVTGVFLWMHYSPGSQNAWESVYYIQNEMQGGWVLRGIHHFMAQAMVVLLPIHMLQVIVDKAYTAPREMNYWLGLVLMKITLALGLTGYLLPWDQKGYWATKVATNLMSLAPGGPYLQKLVVGGSDYGHHTLTRFFALHAGVLPALLVLFLVLHVAMFRKHGITTHNPKNNPPQFFWPMQVLKDGLACALLLVVVLLATIHFDIGGFFAGNLDGAHHGAHLTAPADAVEEYKAARPEWYFLFLFQLLKYFKSEFVGAIVVPGLLFAYLAAMPIVAKLGIGHRVNVAVFALMFLAAGYLTYDAWQEDNYYLIHSYDEEKFDFDEVKALAGDEAELKKQELQAAYRAPYISSKDYLDAVKQGEREYERIRELINYYGIPREGAIALQKNDPETQGPRLFKRHCASCHNYTNAKNEGIAASDVSAPNLHGFGTKDWFTKFLTIDVDESKHGITSDEVFGKTDHLDGEMHSFVHDNLKAPTAAEQKQLDDIVTMLVAQVGLLENLEADELARSDGSVKRGIDAFETSFEYGACSDCHLLDEKNDIGSKSDEMPDLSGYGTAEWLRAFIANPSHERFYGEGNDRMPAFAASVESPEKNSLTAHELDMLVRWLRGDDRDLAAKIGLERKRLAEKAAAKESAANTPIEIDPPAPVDENTEPAENTEPTENTEPAEEPVGLTLFKSNCARCHNFDDGSGAGIVRANPKAPNLHGFASREWLTSFLTTEGIVSDKYFGKTAHAKKDEDGAYPGGRMVEFVYDNLADLNEDNTKAVGTIVAALTAEAKLPSQVDIDKQAADDGVIAAGKTALVDDFACTDCHKFYEDGDLGYATDLTGYGSREWLIEFIANPEAERFYPESNDKMPAFAPHEDEGENKLTKEQLGILADFIRGT